MILSDYAIKFRIAVFVTVAVLVAAGISSYLELPREGMPDITIPHVFVTAVYEGTGPAEIEKLITIPLEKQLNNIEGIKHIKSVSSENVCSVDIEFVAGEDIDLAKQRVKDKVDLAKPDLPNDLDEPIVQAFNVSSDIPIFIFALSGKTIRCASRTWPSVCKTNLNCCRGYEAPTLPESLNERSGSRSTCRD